MKEIILATNNNHKKEEFLKLFDKQIIIKTLKESPYNANQLSKILKLDYRTVRHHLKILLKNKLVAVVGDGYGQAYFVHPILEENYVLFEQITNRIWEKQKRKKNT